MNDSDLEFLGAQMEETHMPREASPDQIREWGVTEDDRYLFQQLARRIESSEAEITRLRAALQRMADGDALTVPSVEARMAEEALSRCKHQFTTEDGRYCRHCGATA